MPGRDGSGGNDMTPSASSHVNRPNSYRSYKGRTSDIRSARVSQIVDHGDIGRRQDVIIGRGGIGQHCGRRYFATTHVYVLYLVQVETKPLITKGVVQEEGHDCVTCRGAQRWAMACDRKLSELRHQVVHLTTGMKRQVSTLIGVANKHT